MVTVKFSARPNSERLLEMLSEIEPVNMESVLAEYLDYTDELQNDKHKNLYTYISTKIEQLNENEKIYLRELSIMKKLDNSHVV
ncbi:unnamed protein product, partial [Oppiella nova]